MNEAFGRKAMGPADGGRKKKRKRKKAGAVAAADVPDGGGAPSQTIEQLTPWSICIGAGAADEGRPGGKKKRRQREDGEAPGAKAKEIHGPRPGGKSHAFPRSGNRTHSFQM